MQRRFSGHMLGLLSLLVGLLAEWGCDLPHQPGPLPHSIIEAEFEPGLNILGVLRLDDDTVGTSFIYIEQAYGPADYDRFADTLPIVKNAIPIVHPVSDHSTLNQFVYLGEISGQKYINPYFYPVAGETYQLTINAPGLPMLTAQTTIPHQPQIDTSSIALSSTELSFILMTREDAFLYEIYVMGTEGQTSQRLNNQGNGNATIKIPLSSKLGSVQAIWIYAYDHNLAQVMNATSSIIPQAFLETISTVSGGYGCFGSLALLQYKLP